MPGSPVAKGPDPRLAAPPREAVPELVRAGADAFNARRFWDAHEHWEPAWHALRAADEVETAGYLRGMILVSAALENATRGKEAGFKRQMAEGLHALLAHPHGAAALGVVEGHAWERDLTRLYADACRRRDWTWWNDQRWEAPPLRLT